MKSLFCIFLMFFCLSTYAQNKVVRRKGTISQTEVSASKKTTTTQSKNNFKKPQISKVKSSDNQINKIGLFSDGYAMIRRNKKCGYIDKTGKEIIPCIFDFADDFQDGVAFVEKGGKWELIDRQGKEIVPFKYDAIIFAGFNDGLVVCKV